jgi:hypothetical protein
MNTDEQINKCLAHNNKTAVGPPDIYAPVLAAALVYQRSLRCLQHFILQEGIVSYVEVLCQNH